jgi:BNR repeat-like domain
MCCIPVSSLEEWELYMQKLARRRILIRFASALLIVIVAVGTGLVHFQGGEIKVAHAASELIKLSSDPYTNSTSQHQTEVEPDTFSYGSTIVMAIQAGRFVEGASSNIGWATSTDYGATWQSGFLPGTTLFSTPAGPFDRIGDPTVAFDAKHGVWLIASLPINSVDSTSVAGVVVNRSTDGGLTWDDPVAITRSAATDKDWIVCDNSSTSAFFGHCYTEWDDTSNGAQIEMSTSTDGGLTWGTAESTAGNDTGVGGQPVVQPDGTVIVPIDNANMTSLLVFRSTDGGASWTSASTITTFNVHTVAGNFRTDPLPSAEVDATGNIYVVWQDCHFQVGCSSNDIVMTTSTDGSTWSTITRIPIDATSSTVDHFIPGIGVDPSTSGLSAHIGIAYYYYPSADCTVSTCQLMVGYVSSTDGGNTWGMPTTLAGPMSLGWIANTYSGPMVGDYISTSWSGGKAFPGIIVANPPSGSSFDEALYTVSGGL